MYMGIDIGATKTVLATHSNPQTATEELKTVKFATSPDFNDFRKALEQHTAELSDSQNIQGLGVAVPGQFDGNRLRTTYHLPWHGTDFSQALAGICQGPIAARNDADLGALAEARLGQGKGFTSVLYITISTGIGTGLTIDGQIPAALGGSEGGHIILDLTTGQDFDALASGAAFVARFSQQAHEVKDPSIWQDYGRILAPGMYSLIVTIQPQIVVIGGSMGVYFEHYYNPMLESIESLNNNYMQLPKITGSTFAETAPLRGALFLAADSRDANA